MSTVITEERRRRGFFGVVFKWGFILYNLAMGWWLIAYWVKASAAMKEFTSEAARAGGSVGVVVGTGAIAMFWVAGALVLGLLTVLTRGKTVVIHERAAPDRDR